MEPYIDPGCLGFLFELAKGNKAATGCITFLFSLWVVIVGYQALRETLIMSVDETTATNWSIFSIASLVTVSVLFKLLRGRKQ